MLAKMILLVLTAVILILGNVNAIDEAQKAYMDVSIRCAPHQTRNAYGACILKGHGIVDDNGNWDKKKLEDVIKTSYAGTEPPAGMIAAAVQCVDDATGETLEAKMSSFFDCVHQKPDPIQKMF